MKKFILLSLLGISLSSYALYRVNVFDFHHLFGKCEGSDYCRICTNCSRCGYCKGGGTCGVCYTPRAIVRRSAPPKKNRSEKSVSSNHVHSIDSRTTSVKRYYLQKPAARKNPLHREDIKVHEPKTDSTSSSDETKSVENETSTSLNKVKLANKPHHISVSPITPDEKETFALEIPENADFVRITAASANLREQFSTKSPVLQKLKHGDLLIKLKSVKGWVKVQTLDSGEIGYVSVSLVR